MESHQRKIMRISDQLRLRDSNEPLILMKKAVSHQVPKADGRKDLYQKLDVSDLDEIIDIDVEKRICTAEPGATFEKIVESTLAYGLVPLVVPELRTITIGGAVSGGSIESMSYRFGGFHDSCLEYEVLTAKGDIIVCSPEGDESLLFNMMHWSFGTLGIITLIKFRLIPAKPYVKVTYEKYRSLEEYNRAIWSHYLSRDIDFMDGIIHSPEEYVLSCGNFTDDAPYTHRYDWMRIYYHSTASRREDYLKTSDYFFRYNKGVTNVRPKSFAGRLLFGRLVSSDITLRMAHRFVKILPEKAIPITVDTFIPFSRMGEFMKWYEKNINHFPLWCVPYKLAHKYEWLSDEFSEKVKDELFLDIAIYGMYRENPEIWHRLIEEELMDIGAIKTLISSNHYSEEEFWSIFNKENYETIKRSMDPDNILRDIYKKTCFKSQD